MYYAFPFTFHYVSIKSEKVHNDKVGLLNLHSTMYLLNHIDFATGIKKRFIYIPLCIY